MTTIPRRPPLLSFDKANAGVWFDLPRLIVSRLLIQANSGGGKSRAIRYICEQTHGRIQHIVLDREGEFSTLREKFPYLLVGRDGEVAADVRTAKLLARKLLELRLSAVIDLSEMPINEQREYVATFIRAINHLPRTHWAPHGCLIFLDEGHIYAPEKGKGSSIAREELALLNSLGRKRGFCPIIATQRLAKLDKDVAAECLNKLIGRTSSEDTARAAEELGQSKQESRELRALEPGEFWAYGPALSREPVLVRTGDVQTHPPNLGAVQKKPPATPDAIKAAMADLAELPAQAAEEEQTVEGLRRELASVRAELVRASHVHPDAGRVRTETVLAPDPEAEARGYARGKLEQLKRIENLLGNIGVEIEKIRGGSESLLERVMAAEKSAAETAAEITVPDAVAPVPRRLIETAPPREQPYNARLGVPAGNTNIMKGERAILAAIAQYPDGVSRDQLTVLTGYKRSSRDEYVRRLVREGYVADAGGIARATPNGIRTLGSDYAPLPRGAELRRYWLERLPAGEAKLFKELCEAWPNPIGREHLGERAGFKRSSRDEYVRRLRARRLVEDKNGMLVASTTLFER